MATTSALDRVTAVVLRLMRPPVFVLIAVYAIGIIGMALLPGQDADGNPTQMSLFHAFYFFTYTATTTGFGEIPYEFTNEQRLWTIFCLYMGVIAWLYAIGSIIKLVQNPHFVQAVAERRFAQAVKGIHQPFFIICGFGDTGSLLARGLSDNLITTVVIDNDSERVKALALRDYNVATPGLCGDASVPQHLIDAGVQSSNCQGVVALTNDEDTNLKIAVMTRTLNASVEIVCRSTSRRHQVLLRSLELVTPIDPFELFAEQLSTTITAPRLRTLEDWFVCARGVTLDKSFTIPLGTWFLCGYGRMGRWIHNYLAQHDVPVVVIDPDPPGASPEEPIIREHPDPDILNREGFCDAAGLVCGTHSDAENLAILLSARSLNPRAFAIVRQNHHENHLAFEGAKANLTMQPSLITARKILLTLIAPLASALLEELHKRGEQCTQEVIAALITAVRDEKPVLWRQRIDRREAVAVERRLVTGARVKLGDVLRDPYNSERRLACVALAICRGKNSLMLPEDNNELRIDDELLFCGTRRGQYFLDATLNNPGTLHYLVTGQELPRGYFFTWLARRLARQQKPAVTE